MQYADDATIFVSKLTSIKHVMTTINNFADVAGTKLNMSKTRGIWLGNFKDLGIRKFHGITWTGKPVKCLGIYIGHNKEQCNKLNWDKKIESMKQVLNKYRSHCLTLYGKVTVIKQYALSKLVFPATHLNISIELIKEINKICFEFLWNGKRDRVKRSSTYNPINDAGLNMINIELFFKSLKASWVTKYLSLPGKWKTILGYYCDKLCISPEYLFHMNFKTKKSFPLITHLPVFYQDVILAYNECKTVKPLNICYWSVHC